MPLDPQSRDAATLLDIRIAGSLIKEFVSGAKLESFLRDAKTRSAVIHQILVIGEASRRLSEGFKLASPRVPWSNVSSMRNRLIHEYDDVDVELVWETATVHVPSLLRELEHLLPPDPSAG